MHADACIAIGQEGATCAQGCCETHQAVAKLSAIWDCSKGAQSLPKAAQSLVITLGLWFALGCFGLPLTAFSASPACQEPSSAAADGLGVPLPIISADALPKVRILQLLYVTFNARSASPGNEGCLPAWGRVCCSTTSDVCLPMQASSWNKARWPALRATKTASQHW